MIYESTPNIKHACAELLYLPPADVNISCRVHDFIQGEAIAEQNEEVEELSEKVAALRS